MCGTVCRRNRQPFEGSTTAASRVPPRLSRRHLSAIVHPSARLGTVVTPAQWQSGPVPNRATRTVIRATSVQHDTEQARPAPWTPDCFQRDPARLNGSSPRHIDKKERRVESAIYPPINQGHAKRVTAWPPRGTQLLTMVSKPVFPRPFPRPHARAKTFRLAYRHRRECFQHWYRSR